MRTNRLLGIAIGLSSVVVIPLQWITTFLLGILANLTFGLILIPFSVVWTLCFLGPLLALSWLWGKTLSRWEKAPVLTIPLAVVGTPLAFVGNIYVSLIPSMGERDSRISKLLLTESWPHTRNCMRLIANKLLLFTEPGAEEFGRILTQFTRVPPYQEFLQSLPLDAQREAEILILRAREEELSEEMQECDDAGFEERRREMHEIRRNAHELSMISVARRRESEYLG